jgi:hypothetical protein
VDTTAETFVGGDDDEEFVGSGFVVGVLEDLCILYIYKFGSAN